MPDILAHRSLESLDEEVHSLLAGKIEARSSKLDPLGPRGPVWARDYALGGPGVCTKLADVLSRCGAIRMVVGHTIQRDFRVHARCGGRIILGDTAISQAYGGQMSFLEHDEAGTTVVYPSSGERLRLQLADTTEPQSRLNSVVHSAEALHMPTSYCAQQE